MADIPTCSEYSVEVARLLDAKDKPIPLDTTLLYDRNGDVIFVKEFKLKINTVTKESSWVAVGSYKGDNSWSPFIPQALFLTRPDSLKQLVEDIERAQYACDHNGLHVAACRYSGNNTCCGCDFRPDYSTCSGKMLEDIAARINRLCGDSE